MYSGLTSTNSTSQGTYKIFKAMSSLYFSNFLSPGKDAGKYIPFQFNL